MEQIAAAVSPIHNVRFIVRSPYVSIWIYLKSGQPKTGQTQGLPYLMIINVPDCVCPKLPDICDSSTQ